MADLRERFEAFVKTLRGFESIDELLKDVHIEGKKRADYLFLDRGFIVEQKVLVVDPSQRPQQYVDELVRQGRLMIFGKHPIERVFASLPDGDERKRELIRGITKGVEDSFTTADKQTRDTREILSIPDAVGIVVILNVSAPTLHPDLVRYGLSEVLKKKREDGSVRYPNNDGVIMISEAHTDTALGPLVST